MRQHNKWRLQIVTSNIGDKMRLRYVPFCFSEQGVTMLACILNSERAIKPRQERMDEVIN